MSMNEYFTSKEIYARLSSTYKNKMTEFDVIDIMRFCAELVVEILEDPMDRQFIKGLKLGFGTRKEIKGNRVPLPPFICKLEAIYDQDKKLIPTKAMSRQGEYLLFPDTSLPKEVFIDYYTIPLDEQGFPFIKRGYEQACYAFCVYKMFEEDSSMIPPRIQNWKWQEIVQDKNYEVEAAARSWNGITKNEIKEIMGMMIDPFYLEAIKQSNPSMINQGGMI